MKFLREYWELLIGPSLSVGYMAYGLQREDGFTDWPWAIAALVLSTVIAVGLYTHRRANQQLRQRGYQAGSMFDRNRSGSA